MPFFPLLLSYATKYHLFLNYILLFVDFKGNTGRQPLLCCPAYCSPAACSVNFYLPCSTTSKCFYHLCHWLPPDRPPTYGGPHMIRRHITFTHHAKCFIQILSFNLYKNTFNIKVLLFPYTVGKETEAQKSQVAPKAHILSHG